MAHSVCVNITSHPLRREESGVDFVVEDGGGKFGELRVSKGGVRWKPKGKQDHHFMSWETLDQLMREQPRR
ncbi:MAG: hypothetical protein K2X43_20800 [Hyphomonadaceae bacterium]|nr:hypothetical protein [Hyphomonadaceae bacterium]